MFSITKKVTLKYYIALFVVSIESLKSLKYHTFWRKKLLVISIIY